LGIGSHWATLTNLPVTLDTNGAGIIAVTNLPGAQKFLRLSPHNAPRRPFQNGIPLYNRSAESYCFQHVVAV
jgi:hypothetical protein